ncbi:MAG: aminoacyl-tRNA hydrolase [Bifidobacteriaceae bacterium]|nr:aminoacyl-tRNA hydrolase [Bifidobacteriaceae bacterium]
MFLVVGLGNPGGTYSKNRHNIGFLCADKIADDFDAAFGRSKFEGLATKPISSSAFNSSNQDLDNDFAILKPTTFMNNSGNSVQKAMQFYRLKAENVIVMHDDIDLQFADIRVKLGGSDAGHNGLKSITSAIGSNYNRIRIGIGRPNRENNFDKGPAILDFVLGDFSKKEFELLDADNVFERVKKEALSIINN